MITGLAAQSRLIRRGLHVAVSVALLALLWVAADGQTAWQSLRAADWPWLMLGLAALTAQTLLSAIRWRMAASALGILIRKRDAVAEYYLSQVVNQSLPGGVLGDAGRAVRARGQAGLAASAHAVIAERLAGQIALFTIFAIAFALTRSVPGGLDWPNAVAGPVTLGIGGLLCLPLVVRALSRTSGRIGRSLSPTLHALRHALFQRATWRAQTALSLATALCNLAAFACAARAVGVDLSLGAVTALVPLVLFTMVIPVSVSGWGLREGAAAALLPLAGASASGGFAASAAFGLTFAAATLPGFAVLWRLRPALPPRT